MLIGAEIAETAEIMHYAIGTKFTRATTEGTEDTEPPIGGDNLTQSRKGAKEVGCETLHGAAVTLPRPRGRRGRCPRRFLLRLVARATLLRLIAPARATQGLRGYAEPSGATQDGSRRPLGPAQRAE